MTVQDLACLATVQCIEPDAYAAGTTTGAVIDTQGYYQAIFIATSGTLSGTADVKVTECDTSGGTYTDVAGGAFVQFSASDDDAVKIGRVNCNERQRYLQLSQTHGNTNDFGVTVVLLPYYSGDGSTFDFEV